MLPLKSKILLFPYWIALKIRHFLYDKNIKKGYSFPIPIITIGNITVGGTGKTPHTEMLIRFFKERYKIAVLSRGYKRESKGFIIASKNDSYKIVGDEPLQIKQKYPDIIVAVCNNRQEGIKNLLNLEENERPNLILLDDAFQHRRVIPSHSIVLIKYTKPIFKDNLLPIGKLRDLPEQVKRADTIIITKTPYDQYAYNGDSNINYNYWREKLKLTDTQELYFSTISYQEPLPLDYSTDNRYIYSGNAIYFTGIANDTEFRNHLLSKYKIIDSLKFPDHCKFSKSATNKINSWALKYPLSPIFTTEKDIKRLYNNRFLLDSVKKRLFYIPIEVNIIPNNKAEEFIIRIKDLIGAIRL